MNSGLQPLCFCVAGWHFNQDLLEALSSSGHPVWLISHRPASQVPAFLSRCLPPERCLYLPNLGYDWGCYQQFLDLGLWQGFETVFFLHDDLQILNLDFIPCVQDRLQSGALAVGNGRNSPRRRWPRTHLACYAHSRWLPPSLDFEHDTVRGSFFALRSATLQQLGGFEIFWDPHHLHLRFGNHSLIATCGKIEALTQRQGQKVLPAFAFLSEEYRSSPYLIEKERGQNDPLLRPPPSPWQRLVTQSYILFGEAYVRYRMRQPPPTAPHPRWMLLCQRLLYWMNGASQYL